MANETVFKRYVGNPIVKPTDLAGTNSISNSAAIKFGDGYVGIFRVDGQAQAMELHVGWSKDGIKWTIEPNVINVVGEIPQHIPPGYGYDPRITEIDGTYYVTWCYYPIGRPPCIGLAKTTDFRTFVQISTIVFPYDRNAVLFPKKINGHYAMLHRPSDHLHTAYGDIFYCTSPDLVHWGNNQLVFSPSNWWESTKVGAGPAPIETKDGWLLIYHGVRTNCNGYLYCAGGAILDLNNPAKVLYKAKPYLLAPTELYETVGDTPNVVFPTGLVLNKSTNQLTLYYGAADTSLCIAYADLNELLDFIKSHS